MDEDAYRSWIEQHQGRTPPADEEPRRKGDAERAARQAAQREQRRRERRRSEIEETIRQLEARMKEVEAELAEASTAQEVERVTELGVEHSRLQAELDAQLAHWESLA